MDDAGETELIPVERLRERLAEVMPQLDAPSVNEVVAELAPTFAHEMPSSPEDQRAINRALNRRNTVFAVRTKDLQLLKESAVIAAAAYAAFRDPIGVLAGLVLLLFRYRQNRVRLDAEQGAILKTLKDAMPDGLSIAQLGTRLSLAHIPEDKLAEILKTLKSAVKENGEQIPLVFEQDGRWRTIDL